LGVKVELYQPDFKSELVKVIDQLKVKAIIMGNRSTDPWSQNLQPICASSPGWPEFTRVFPILDWSYHEVWAYLLLFRLDYCSLYDAGYTSLGEMHNSV
jgi:FAD synthetase